MSIDFLFIKHNLFSCWHLFAHIPSSNIRLHENLYDVKCNRILSHWSYFPIDTLLHTSPHPKSHYIKILLKRNVIGTFDLYDRMNCGALSICIDIWLHLFDFKFCTLDCCFRIPSQTLTKIVYVNRFVVHHTWVIAIIPSSKIRFHENFYEVKSNVGLLFRIPSRTLT